MLRPCLPSQYRVQAPVYCMSGSVLTLVRIPQSVLLYRKRMILCARCVSQKSCCVSQGLWSPQLYTWHLQFPHPNTPPPRPACTVVHGAGRRDAGLAVCTCPASGEGAGDWDPDPPPPPAHLFKVLPRGAAVSARTANGIAARSFVRPPAFPSLMVCGQRCFAPTYFWSNRSACAGQFNL